MKQQQKVILIFLDGVGIGRKDKTCNPFFAGNFPALLTLFGCSIPHIRSSRRKRRYLSVVPINSTLGIPGLPQSGTGQAALLTGLNAPRIVGRHFGPYLYSSLKPLVREKNIFRLLKDIKKKPYYANAFPRQFLDYIGKAGKTSAITYAWLSAGYRLLGENAILGGKGLSADMTNERWRSLGYPDMPLITARDGGKRLVNLADGHHFVLYEYFFTDHAGHTRSMEEGVRVLKNVDEFMGGVLDTINTEKMLLVIISDHGNLEDMSTRSHTRNPVPLVAFGRGHDRFTAHVSKLTDVVPALLNCMM
jgi:2,3-bisphosphoglycerate-independent phosphoglycerate mutase